jgi:predicted permease
LRVIAPSTDRAVILGDLDEEFRARASTSPSRARAWYWRQTLASLPSALRLRIDRASPFGDLGGDLRLALRVLRRQPGFAAAAIVTMALGAGITTGAVSIVEGVLLRPLPYANADRVYSVRESDGVRHGGSLSWADFVELSTELRSFSALAGYNGGSRTLTGDGAAERLPATYVTPRFFSVLGVTPALGRDFGEADGVRGAPSVVILSDKAWRRRFNADAGIVGRLVTLSGEPTTIIGVLPRSFIFPPRADPDLWMPLRPSRAQEERPYLHFLDVLGVLTPGVTPAMAADELRKRTRTWNTGGAAWHASTGLHAVSLRDDMVSGVRPVLYVLLGASLLVLVTAAANVAGLVLVRAAGRSREAAVRSALGATRYRLMRQLLTEALCLALCGSATGLLVARGGLDGFAAVTPLRIRAALPYATDVAVSPRAAAFGVLLTVLAVIAANVWPAFRAARSAAPLVTGTRTMGSRADTRVRAVLVAAQIALAVVLLAGASLVARSAIKLSRVSPGFEIDGLVSGRISLPPARYTSREAIAGAVDRLLASARAVPGVAGAEAINQLPLTGSGNSGDFTIVGRASTPSSNPLIRDVTPGYFPLMGIPLVEGRRILDSDTRTAPRVVVVNRTLARFYFPDGNALGQRIVFAFFEGKPEWTIVGVVGDEQFDGLDRPMAPVVYFPFAQDPEGSFSLVARATSPEAAIEPLRAAVASVDSELPLYAVNTLVRTAAESNAVFLRAIVMRLLAWFAIAALVLAGVGIYGILAEAMAARTREIGLRVALGATRGRIVRLVARTGLAPAAAGLAAGALLAATAGPAVRSLLYGVGLLDLPSLAAVLAVIALVVLTASAVPLRRALRVPIAAALRQE